MLGHILENKKLEGGKNILEDIPFIRSLNDIVFESVIDQELIGEIVKFLNLTNLVQLMAIKLCCTLLISVSKNNYCNHFY